jgi:hypothetical protein
MGCSNCGGNCGGQCGPAYHVVTGGTGVQENALQRPLTAGTTELCDTLAFNLIDVADGLRDLYTTFGLRPYRVQLVRSRWTHGVRGQGVEQIISAIAVLPTPLLSDMTTLAEINSAIGADETGEVLLSQVSGSFTEDQLRGHPRDGEPVPVDEQFYYEIEFPPACRGDAGEKRRFTLKSAPMYYADRFQWNIRLEKQRQDRGRNGDPR